MDETGATMNLEMETENECMRITDEVRRMSELRSAIVRLAIELDVAWTTVENLKRNLEGCEIALNAERRKLALINFEKAKGEK